MARWVFIGLILLSLTLVAVVGRPFAEAFFLAAVLAGTLYRWQDRLSERLGGRRNVAASLLCVAVAIAILGPIAGVGAYAVKESVAGVRFVTETVRSEGMTGLLDRLPASLRELGHDVVARLPMEPSELDEALQKQGADQGKKAAGVVTTALASTGAALLQTGMMLIALFFLLVDGGKLVSWIEQVSPLKPGQALELLREFRRVSGSVLISSIATAGVQAAAALVGYLIAGVPHPLFFTVITFFMAFIPAVGGGGVALLAALLLVVQGKVWLALFLAVWAVFVVGLVDNLVKPLLAKRGMQMHGAIVFFSLLGGLAAFGTVGLLLGPLIVSAFLALVRIYQRDFVGESARSSADVARSSADVARTSPPAPPPAPLHALARGAER